MKIIKGKYGEAKVFTNNIGDGATKQIQELLNQEWAHGAHIRIMPDCHAGKGCVIGTTLLIKDKIVPNLVGLDIGCGMLCVELGKMEVDFVKLDAFIRNNIPSGFSTNNYVVQDEIALIESIYCKRSIPKTSNEITRALGTLGGGNHFIEIDEDEFGYKYLVVHTGSRNLGKQVATYYQEKAIEKSYIGDSIYEEQKEELLNRYSDNSTKKELKKALRELKKSVAKELKTPKALCYLENKLKDDYMHDMQLVQKYADINRTIIAKKIVNEFLGCKFEDFESFQTIHNYIDLENNILRKGAVSAMLGEFLLIPINMRDGSLICEGLGNHDWNMSAPHGAGRLMSRREAKANLNMDEFKESMEGIFSTCVNIKTLDESPMSYKPIEEILDNIQETVKVIKHITPLYNYKAE